MTSEKNISYLSVVRKYEQENNSLSVLLNYFNEDNSNLIKLYCDGRACLPSPNLIKDLCFRIQDDLGPDKELSKLFVEASKYSKIFYDRLEKLLTEARYSHLDFDSEFSYLLQPIGQTMINLLKSIKARVYILRSTHPLSSTNQSQIGNHQPKDYVTWLTNNICQYLYIPFYKLTLAQVSNHNTVKNCYYLASIITGVLLLLIDFLIFERQESPVKFLTFCIVSVIGVLIASFTVYPITDFRKTDVHGKNLIAYRYRLFLNNPLNKRLRNILSL